MSGAADEQQAIIEEFELFDDWLDRYQYIIDLGKKLEPLAPEEQRDEALLDGCQSQVWLIAEGDADRMVFRANSDAAIVSGLIFLVLRVYSGRCAKEIVDTPPDFVDAIGLSQHLSQTRANGLASMLAAIKGRARQALMERGDGKGARG